MSQEIRCPSCGGGQFEVVSPGRLRCVSETITGAVPPGQGGNLGSATLEQEARWAAAAADLLARKTAALAKLNELGNPGAIPRMVPGRYYLSLSRRLLQQVGEVLPVEAEPAWPVGTCKWHRRVPAQPGVAVKGWSS
jgi:hypothetical protein